jgi:uncharacterized protein YukE
MTTPTPAPTPAPTSTPADELDSEVGQPTAPAPVTVPANPGAVTDNYPANYPSTPAVPMPAQAPTPPTGGTGTTVPTGTTGGTAPLTDDSGQLGGILTGQPAAPSTAGATSAPPTPSSGIFGGPQSSVQALPTDYQGQSSTAIDDYDKSKAAEAALQKKLDGSDLPDFFKHNLIHDTPAMKALSKFGVEDPAAVAKSSAAAKNGAQQLEHYSSSINSGEGSSVATADELLKPGEAGLAFFRYFLPAYNAWTGQSVQYDTLKQAYEQEFGLSFADYSSDAQLFGQIASDLTDKEQTLQNAYNTLIPQWQGQAAASFEAKLTVFFTAAGTVHQDVAAVGKDVQALVQGLQQLVLAKAQTVNGLYADELPPGIDGGMAQTIVKIAQGTVTDLDQLITMMGLFGSSVAGPMGPLGPFGAFSPFGPFGGNILLFEWAAHEVQKEAVKMATDWCNTVLTPQTETRLQALNTVCTQTEQRIQQAFAQLTGELTAIKDPFAGMTAAPAKKIIEHVKPPVSKGPKGPGTPPTTGGGGGGGGTTNGSSTGGGGGGGSFTPPAAPTYPSGPTPGSGTTTTQGAGTTPVTGVPTLGTDPTTGTTRPAGLPTGASWIPPGVALPSGWTQDPTTGEALPQGGSVDPTTGLPVQTAGTTGGTSTTGTSPTGTSTTGVDPKQDIHKNADGSVSLGPDRGLTITPEKGKKGVFTLSDTDADGTAHTYHVHFDAHGNPVVSEIVPKDDVAGLDDITTPASQLTGGGGGGGGGLGGVSAGGSAGLGDVSGGTAAAAHAGADAGSSELQPGEQVAGDNTMSASSSPPQGSPVAGSAPAPDQSGGQQGGGVGGMPMGGGMGRGGGGGGEQESARKYQQRGDVVGDEDLEEWQRMGPVIGEQ